MTVLQRKASMQQNAFLLMPAIKGDMYINTHCNYSQPTLIKLDNENIGGHLTPLHWVRGSFKIIENGTIRKPGYGFLVTSYSNYNRILCHFRNKAR